MATLTGKRVLFIDTAGNRHGAPQALVEALRVPLDALPPGRSLNDALVNIGGTSFFYTALRGHGGDGVAFSHIDLLKRLMEDLRLSYDLIILHSSALLSNAYGMALLRLTDGCVLVIEAERTRHPVAEQVRRMIQDNGGQVLGAVLNKRRFHIPRWVYRIFFRQ
jgi:hypothetical protein